jgi:hypothetical protein
MLGEQHLYATLLSFYPNTTLYIYFIFVFFWEKKKKKKKKVGGGGGGGGVPRAKIQEGGWLNKGPNLDQK